MFNDNFNQNGATIQLPRSFGVSSLIDINLINLEVKHCYKYLQRGYLVTFHTHSKRYRMSIHIFRTVKASSGEYTCMILVFLFIFGKIKLISKCVPTSEFNNR